MSPSSAESDFKRGLKMKKIKTSRGFWDWLLGGGYSGTGGHG